VDIHQHGQSATGKKRYISLNTECMRKTFILDPHTHLIGKQNTQKIERKHLALRTRIKRLARKTICFSKSIVMHDIVIGSFDQQLL
jgi:IS1 family transposase